MKARAEQLFNLAAWRQFGCFKPPWAQNKHVGYASHWSSLSSLVARCGKASALGSADLHESEVVDFIQTKAPAFKRAWWICWLCLVRLRSPSGKLLGLACLGDSSYIFQKNALGMSWHVFSPHLFSRLPVAGIHLWFLLPIAGANSPKAVESPRRPTVRSGFCCCCSVEANRSSSFI